MVARSPIFLIAHPRSGTHALASIIAQKPDIFAFGEVFNPSPDSEIYPANYYHFLRALQDTPLASPKNAETRFHSYLAYLSGRAGDARILVDIKYDTLHLFDAELRDISAPPSIFSFLSDQDVAIIHLKRNILHIYISLMNAAATNQWQVAPGEAIKRGALFVDIEHMLDFLSRKAFEQKQVSRYVRSTGRCIEVWYEHLFGPGAIGAFQNLSAFLGLDQLAVSTSAFAKQIDRPYCELIENYDEVAAALTDSAFAALLTEAPEDRSRLKAAE
jgi:LPS sulfotransferase NodH